MCSTLSFLVQRRFLGLLGLGPAGDRRDVEIAVLRHQLAVLGRQAQRPRYNDSDRLIWSVLAKLLPRERWGLFLVTPATLLRWHPELVRRHWTQRHRPQRPGLPDLDINAPPARCRSRRLTNNLGLIHKDCVGRAARYR